MAKIATTGIPSQCDDCPTLIKALAAEISDRPAAGPLTTAEREAMAVRLADCESFLNGEHTDRQAAWAVCGIGEKGAELWFFEAHAADDEDSPTGEGFYFASWNKDGCGWEEYDGGQYWGYASAGQLEEAIGGALPFHEYSCRPIPYADFEAVCHGGDGSVEQRYAGHLLHDGRRLARVSVTEGFATGCGTVQDGGGL
jgi:hypothetical protein